MNYKFHITTLRGTLIIIFLLTLTLNACGGKPVEVAPAEPVQPAAAMEATTIPSPIPTASPTPSDIDDPYYPVDPSLVTKPDVPPQSINGVTAKIDWAYADESR